MSDFPLFVRGGSILPLAPVGAQYVAESQAMGPLEVHIYSGANTQFVVVEDDGESTGYATATKAVREIVICCDSSALLFLQ